MTKKKMDVTPRPYRDEQDLARMEAILIAGRKSGGPTYYVHIGDLRWWLRYLNSAQDRRETIIMWEGDRADGDLIGMSMFWPQVRAFDVFVHPEDQGSARAEAIWVWTAERMCEIVKEQGGENVLTMWISEHDAELIALLRRRGFSRSDYCLHTLTRSLDEFFPEPPLPRGYRVRHVAGEHEAAARAAVAHAAFESALPVEVYGKRYLAFMRSSVYRSDLDLVVVAPGGQFGAFCICWLDPANKVGLFEPVGTGPDYRRRGLGKALLYAGMRRMQARGMATATVCVAHDNLPAQKLYTSVGFRRAHKIYAFAREV